MVWRMENAMLQGQTTRNEVRFIPSRAAEGEMIALLVPLGHVYCPAETVMRVTDWARWAKPRLGLDTHGRCASAEGRYVSEYPDAARDVKFEMDLHAVLQVERVVCVKLPKLHKELVIHQFVRQDTQLAIARRLALSQARYGDELKRAVLMIRNGLTCG